MKRDLEQKMEDILLEEVWSDEGAPIELNDAIPRIKALIQEEVESFAEKVKIKGITDTSLKPFKWSHSGDEQERIGMNQAAFELIDMFNNKIDEVLKAYQ